MFLENEGNSDTPIRDEVQALDTLVAVVVDGIPTLLYSRGPGGNKRLCFVEKEPQSAGRLSYLEMTAAGRPAESKPVFDIWMDGLRLIGAAG